MLAFFGAFLAYNLVSVDVNEVDEDTSSVLAWVVAHSTAAAGVVMAAAVILAWRRVVLGYHTVAQVIVGFVVGTGFGLGWATHPVVSADWVDEALVGHRTAKCVCLCVAALTSLYIRWLPSYSARDSERKINK